MSDEQVNLRSATPILTSHDINATEAFYTEKLGFQTLTKYSEAGYLILMHDGVVLHFTLVDGGDSASSSHACYIYVEGVDAFYEQARAVGAVHPNSTLSDKAWGMREFSLLDPDGNLLRVGEDVS